MPWSTLGQGFYNLLHLLLKPYNKTMLEHEQRCKSLHHSKYVSHNNKYSSGQVAIINIVSIRVIINAT